jgi:nucleoside-diphosphate-sugar epimerase
LVGTQLVRHFSQMGWRVYAGTSQQDLRNREEMVEYVPFQLSSVATNSILAELLERVDAVIHAAAVLPAQQQDARLFELNVVGTFTLLRMVAERKLGKFIFISTANMFAPSVELIEETTDPAPSSVYALSKYLGEEMVLKNFSKQICQRAVLRISAPYGPDYRAKSVLPRFVEQALRGEDLEIMGTGEREQTFTSTRDIAYGCQLLIDSGISGLFNIAGDGPITMRELATMVIEVAQPTRSRIIYSKKPDPMEGIRRRISIEAARCHFGYVPQIPIRQGLEDLIQNLKDREVEQKGVAPII